MFEIVSQTHLWRIVLKKTLLLVAGLTLATLALAQSVEITVWSGYPEMEAFYNHVAEDYKSEHPDVTITVLTQPLREYERRVTAALPAGNAADILEMSSSFAGRLVQAGLFQPAPEEVAQFVRGDAYNGFFVEAASYDGQVYGVPLFRGQGALFYNTEMFKEAGLDGPPTTMAEYVEDAQALTQRDANGNPTVSGWSLRLSGGGAGIAEKFWTIMHQYGGSLVEEVPGCGWKAGYNNEAGRQTLQLYVDLVNKDRVVTPELKGDAEGFELGSTAMFMRESWVIGDIAQKAPDLEYATALLPTGTIVLPVNLYITRDKPEAFDFALYALKPEYQQWLLKNVGWLPNRQDVDYSGILEETPQLEAFLNLPSEQVLFTVPPITGIDEIETRLAERLVTAYTNASLVDNSEGINKVLADAAAETNQLLGREGLLCEQ